MGFPNIWNLIPRPNLTHLVTYICVCICVCRCVCVCVCAHMCVGVYIYIHTRTHAWVHTHTHTHVCIHVCAYIQLIVSQNNHKRRLLNELSRNSGGSDVASCNCRSKGECPTGGRGNSKNVVYQAWIYPIEYNNDGKRVYIGIPAANWKRGLYNQILSPIHDLETKPPNQN